MATVTKDFKVKNGLIVEGTTGTINNHDILTKKTDDQNYIIGLIGGSSDSANTPNTVVKRDGSGNFAAGEITADLIGNVTGNADTATTLETARTISLTGDVTGSVSFNGSQNVQISTTIDGDFATDAELSSAISQEVSDRNSAIQSAKNDAEDYADNAASNALSAAESYTDSSISAEVSNRNSAIATAKSEAISSSNSYTDGKISDLVDSAPALLDTLNELAAAIADNPNYATDVANLVATKSDTTYVDSQDQYYDGLASGYASSAQSNAISSANSYTDGEISALDSTAQGYANTAQSNAESYTNNAINALSTSDIEEGTNLYYTNARAKSEAASLLANATKTNIVITKDGSDNLTITAENGVADSTTDDLTEGNSNLYFTDARAVSALQAVTPQFQEIDVTWATKNTAAYTYVANASTATAFSWSTNYASAKFLVRVRSGNHSQVSEVLVTADNSNNLAVTEYAIVGTNGNLGNVSANFSGGNYNLTVETTENNSEVIVYATLMAYGD